MDSFPPSQQNANEIELLKREASEAKTQAQVEAQRRAEAEAAYQAFCDKLRGDILASFATKLDFNVPRPPRAPAGAAPGHPGHAGQTQDRSQDSGP